MEAEPSKFTQEIELIIYFRTNMIYKTGWAYLILLLSLGFTCAKKGTSSSENSRSVSLTTIPMDTLLYTSGIRAIFQDSKGNYWFGSNYEGVCCFDGAHFRYFTTEDGLSGNQVFSIQEDQYGTIWLDTRAGVSSFDGQVMTNHQVFCKEPSHELHKELISGKDQSVWEKTENDLWFNAGNREGVFRYDGQNGYYLPFPNPLGPLSGNIHSVTGFSKGQGMIWMSTYAGVFGYDGSELTAITDETIEFLEPIDQLHVRSILEDSKGRLWIGNNGIGVILKEGDSYRHFSKEMGALCLSNQFIEIDQRKHLVKYTGLASVFAIEEDSKGAIWFGDRDTGAWRYDGTHLSNYIIDKKHSSHMIWCIYEDPQQNLLFGMAEGGVYRFNGTSFERWL